MSKLRFRIEWESIAEGRRSIYPVLLEADGPFYFANDWLTHPGWQEGAIQSDRYIVAAIDKHRRESKA